MNIAHLGQWPYQMQLGAVGKLPNQPDFIRAGPAAKEVTAFDRWVEACVAQAQREMGEEAFIASYPRLYHRFVFRAQEGALTLVGVLRAAEDRHSRRYPFAIYALIPRDAIDQNPVIISSLTDSLFPVLEDLIAQAANLDRLADVQALLGSAVDVPGVWPDYAERYESFLDDVTCGNMVGPQAEPGEELLSTFITVVSSHRRRPQAMPQGMCLPLNQPPFARPLEIQFWIELLMILLHWYPQGLSWLWESGDEAPTFASLVLCTRQPASHMFTSLLDERGILWRPWLDKPVTGTSITEWVTVALHRDHTLRQLLEYLCPGDPEVCPWRALQG